MRKVLLDTGFWVALLDRSERTHGRCVEVFEDLDAVLVSTEPVLTETTHLLAASTAAQAACMQFVTRGVVTLVPQSTDSLHRAMDLMQKYSDTPMDLAVATLVVLAEDLGVRDILTLDVKGFSAYRIRHKRTFRILPSPDG